MVTFGLLIWMLSIGKAVVAGWDSGEEISNSPEFGTQSGKCRDQEYTVHLFSEDPLVIYIDSFISAEEAIQLNSMRYAPRSLQLLPHY